MENQLSNGVYKGDRLIGYELTELNELFRKLELFEAWMKYYKSYMSVVIDGKIIVKKTFLHKLDVNR